MPRQHGFRVYWGLLPLSFLYWIAIKLRNRCFDKGIFHSYVIPFPAICIGNLTVGGTGKTPHTEYLIRLLQKSRRVTVFSRGYKRKSKEGLIASPDMTVYDIGDEPWQMKHKFPETEIYVCKQRAAAIQSALQRPPGQRPQVGILDDAFQHRQVKAGLNILLTDYNRQIYDDKLLPAGRLREPFSGRLRAQIIIVTKCPDQLTDKEQHDIIRKLQPAKGQKVFFTHQRYSGLKAVFPCADKRQIALSQLPAIPSILIITGIATPHLLKRDFARFYPNAVMLSYGDHHNFTKDDQESINRHFAQIRQDGSIIVTTEKDAARFQQCTYLDKAVKAALYALPIEIEFLDKQGTTFDHIINDYVRTDQ
ncbi:MAG TPA: tetraacyldisaccharide 4'-kinase [Prevotellaceae bacterium]|nr:tetraacyldisaccharide 4'-kinase [Prevotellaceae bacterium]